MLLQGCFITVACYTIFWTNKFFTNTTIVLKLFPTGATLSYARRCHGDEEMKSKYLTLGSPFPLSMISRKQLCMMSQHSCKGGLKMILGSSTLRPTIIICLSTYSRSLKSSPKSLPLCHTRKSELFFSSNWFLTDDLLNFCLQNLSTN